MIPVVKQQHWCTRDVHCPGFHCVSTWRLTWIQYFWDHVEIIHFNSKCLISVSLWRILTVDKLNIWFWLWLMSGSIKCSPQFRFRVDGAVLQYCIGGRYCDCNTGVLSLINWFPPEMAAISQTTFLNAFSRMKSFEFRFRFHWSFFPRVYNWQ